jgi:hypothetical protein
MPHESRHHHHMGLYKCLQDMLYSVFHKSIDPWFLAENHGNHENRVPTMLPNNLWLYLMGGWKKIEISNFGLAGLKKIG